MIGQNLIVWYEINKRNLPWRDTGDPYLIWVSEIILQQTRVVQGLDYYRRFIDAYPDIFSLARADMDEVLKIWQGLGYYSRARNMHAAAKHIVDVYDGKFPTTYDGLITIKGIGDYTASAIASIAFGQAVPVIDGNVNRVIARLYGIQQPVNKPVGQKEIRTYAEKLLVRNVPGIYNQAIMEFGALQCVPQNPDCKGCILNRVCTAYRNGLADMLPIKEKTAKIATRYFNYLHVRFGNHTFIRRRADGDIWTGLYEFPMIETSEDTGLDDLGRTPAWQSYFGTQTPLIEAVSGEITHRLTHRILKIRFYKMVVDKPVSGQHLIEIPATDIHRYAVPKVIDNYLKNIH
jgi:A/G-specific adenine glycosylase